MRFISTIIIIYLIWQVVKFIFKIAFRYWIKKNAGKAFQYSAGFGGNGQKQSRPEGDIKVESFGNAHSKSSRKNSKDLGEYVDYEEVK